MKKAILLLILLMSCTQPVQTKLQQPEQIQMMPSGTIMTQDGETIAYQLYSNPEKPAIILLHMLGRTRTDWDTTAQWLQKQGYAVIAIDLRGHGMSSGNYKDFTPEDFNKMKLDVKAAKAVLTNQGADTKKLMIIGASIGANTALNYAEEDNDAKSVVALSPGADYKGIKTDRTYTKPALIVASKDDSASAETSQRLAQQNQKSKLILYENAGHGTNMFQQKDLAPAILSWLKENRGE